jgi:uncharacterized BrkB/YihY/UPF0761 family membrane protein
MTVVTTAVIVASASHAAAALYSVISFVVWVLIMVWIYNIAKRKGRHPVGWLILGFFFTFIALTILLLLPSKRTTEGVPAR